MTDSLFSSIRMTIAMSIGLLTGSEHHPTPAPVPAADLQPAAVPGRTITRSADGLFYIEVKLNGMPTLLALDTGANVTVLCAADARRAGLLHGKLAYNERLITGGGRVLIARTKLASAEVMDRDFSNLPVVIARGSFPVSVLGQDLMRRIGRLSIDADQLTLGAPAPSVAEAAS